MLCKDVEHNLPAYLEDALSSQEKALVEEHLATCLHCKKSLAHLKKTSTVLRELEEMEPPPWFTQKIMSRVRKEAKQKEGLFRKLFYPLHIKIPIQALATVLIAVIAFQIYRVGEPEMQVIVAPPAAVFETGKEQAPAAPQKSSEFSPAPAAKGMADSTKDTKKDTDMPVASTPERSEDTIRREEMLIRNEAEPPAGRSPIAVKKRESLQDKTAEEMQTVFSAKRQETPKTVPAPALEYKHAERGDYAGTDKAKKEYETTSATPQLMGAAVRKLEQISVAVHVTDASVSVREVETLLGKLKARKIQRKSRDDKEILTAVINVQNVRELLEKLKTIGETEEKGIPEDILERDISITIEIIR